jgi:hypothetical protein
MTLRIVLGVAWVTITARYVFRGLLRLRLVPVRVRDSDRSLGR